MTNTNSSYQVTYRNPSNNETYTVELTADDIDHAWDRAHEINDDAHEIVEVG